MRLAIVFLACLEIGLCLVILPWTPVWEMNVLGGFEQLAWLWPNPYFRGGVSGLGLVNLWLCVRELYFFFRG